jgi:hypothetical protein
VGKAKEAWEGAEETELAYRSVNARLALEKYIKAMVKEDEESFDPAEYLDEDSQSSIGATGLQGG